MAQQRSQMQQIALVVIDARVQRCSHVRKSQQACRRAPCSTPPGTVVMRVRVVRKLLDPCKKPLAVLRGFRGHVAVLATYLLRTRSIARSGSVSGAYKSPSIAPCKRIASGGVCAALCHPPLLCKASWRVYSYSSSPPALTPPPHSTAQHHQSQDRLTTHLGSWPGAAAKRQSPTRPHSSVV